MCDSAVSKPTCYGLDSQRFEPRLGRDLTDPSIPAPRPTQPTVQGVSGPFPERKAGGAWRWPPRVEHGWSYTATSRLCLLGL